MSGGSALGVGVGFGVGLGVGFGVGVGLGLPPVQVLVAPLTYSHSRAASVESWILRAIVRPK